MVSAWHSTQDFDHSSQETLTPPARTREEQISAQTNLAQNTRISLKETASLAETRPLPDSRRSPPTWAIALMSAVSHSPLDARAIRYRRAKRALDITVSALCLVGTAPVVGVAGLLIRLDTPGPIFYRQTRVGESGRLFSIIKLRTMTVQGNDRSGNDQVEPDPRRITRVGRHLRRWSLDELPQFLNVLRGEMSLVGPRPERPGIVISRYEDWQFQRFQVPQGMTGWWQVTGRGRTRLCDDTANDLYYISRASFWFDLRILAMTIPAVARQGRSG